MSLNRLMRFAFFASNLVPFHATTLEERPLGGTETGVIRLSEALVKQGHEVFVLTPEESPPASTPRYLPLRAVESLPALDAYICVRDWIPCFYRVNSRLHFLWTGDSYDQFSNFGLGDKRVIGRLDGVLTVSDWQADALSETSGFPREKFFTIRNGIHYPYFEGAEPRNPKRLIYSSTPHRGLVHLPELFLELQRKHSDLELHVFSGYKIYNQRIDEFQPVFEQLKSLPNCHIHDSILQKDLSREFMKSAVLFYPCHFEETSCITAMEAQAAGCVPLTSRLAGLIETVGDAGILIEGLPGKGDYNHRFLQEADQLLSDPAHWRVFSERGRAKGPAFSWTHVADRLVELCKGKFL